jgi:purine-nucleoside phosphorylase
MADVIKPLRTFLSLGVEYVILTTSAGAVNRNYKVGEVMFVRDQINMMGDNPLFEADPLSEPSPFVDVSNIYSKSVNDMADRLCRRARVKSHTGVLAGMRGPVYETPAEIAWLRSMGADAVCMSVIPEALACAHVNVSVTALALIVNSAKGHDGGTLTHQSVEHVGRDNAEGLKRIIRSLLTTL